VNAVLAVFLSLLVGESLIRVLAPRTLAYLALVPFNPPRVVPLPRAATQALAQEASAAWDYRTAPERHLNLARLPGGASVVDANGIRLIFARGGGTVVALRRLDWFKKRPRPLVFVRLRAEGDRIVLSSRFYPARVLTIVPFLAFVAWHLAMGPSLVALIAVGLSLIPFLVIPFFQQRTEVGPLVDAVEAEVASRVRRLTEGVPHVRVASDEAVEEVEREPRPGTSARER
jgi:hypothetical protein